MKQGYLFLLILTSYLTAFGQSPVVFQTLPRDLQLFPRNAVNEAIIVVDGTVTDALAKRVSLQIDRGGKLSQAQQLALTATRLFHFEATIRAELAEYNLRIYLHRQPGDSVLVAERKRIVCGDMFLIYGQSNAFGLENLEKITVNDQFMRQCGYIYNAKDIPSAMQWFPALQPYAAVGAFGLYMGEAIQKATQIPVGFINGAEGGASIALLSDRNASNPADLNTFYGRMLYRSQWAGVQNQFKAIIFKQGEAEAGSSAVNYQASFDRLYKMIRQDYGTVPRFYASQINILMSGSQAAGTLRDFQRRLPEIYPEGVGNLATMGSIGYDGLHYNLPGSQQIGYEQGRQILRDLYASGAAEAVNSPNVRQVFQNSRNDTITVVFEAGMQMKWTNDSTLTKNGQTYTRRLTDVFMADDQTNRFASGRAEGNRIYLALRQPATVQMLSYFPPFYAEAPSGFYDGPTLKNQLGVRAFTFDKYPVARALTAVNTLSVTKTSRQEISLSWTVSTADVVSILLERSGNGRVSFTQIAQLAGNVTTYTDRPIGSGIGPYAYRIRVAGQRSESGVSNVAEGVLLPPCALTATVKGNTTVIYGGTLSLSVVPTGAETGSPITYLWRGPGGLVTAAQNLVQQSLTPGLSGLYAVTVTQGVCSIAASVSVTIQSPLATEQAAPALWPNPVLSGQSISINVPGAEIKEGVAVTLYDTNGRVMFQQKQVNLTGKLSVVLPATLLPGLYIVDIKPALATRQTSRLLIE